MSSDTKALHLLAGAVHLRIMADRVAVPSIRDHRPRPVHQQVQTQPVGSVAVVGHDQPASERHGVKQLRQIGQAVALAPGPGKGERQAGALRRGWATRRSHIIAASPAV